MKTTHETRFTRHPAAVGRARSFVLSALPESVAAERGDDVRLCVSELATNAVAHGTPAGRQFLVRVTHEGDVLRLEVEDSGGGHPCVSMPSDEDDHGRGLLLVADLADDWGVAPRRGPGKCVWAEFKLSAAPAVAPC